MYYSPKTVTITFTLFFLLIGCFPTFNTPDIYLQNINISKINKNKIILDLLIHIRNNDKRELSITFDKLYIYHQSEAIGIISTLDEIKIKGNSSSNIATKVILPKNKILPTAIFAILNNKITLNLTGRIYGKLGKYSKNFDINEPIVLNLKDFLK